MKFIDPKRIAQDLCAFEYPRPQPVYTWEQFLADPDFRCIDSAPSWDEAATKRVIDSIIQSRVPEESYYRDYDEYE